MNLPLTPAQRRCFTAIGICLVLAALTAGCASSAAPDPTHKGPLAGFWSGIFHGAILPFAWVFSLLDSSVAIYAIHNNGGSYDFGFMLGLFVFWKFPFGSSRESDS